MQQEMQCFEGDHKPEVTLFQCTDMEYISVQRSVCSSFASKQKMSEITAGHLFLGVFKHPTFSGLTY